MPFFAPLALSVPGITGPGEHRLAFSRDASLLVAESPEVDYDNPTMLILVDVGFPGRSMYVQGKLQTRLFGVGLPPLGFFASANLLDDERG
jgi:hypothetical protein